MKPVGWLSNPIGRSAKPVSEFEKESSEFGGPAVECMLTHVVLDIPRSTIPFGKLCCFIGRAGNKEDWVWPYSLDPRTKESIPSGTSGDLPASGLGVFSGVATSSFLLTLGQTSCSAPSPFPRGISPPLSPPLIRLSSPIVAPPRLSFSLLLLESGGRAVRGTGGRALLLLAMVWMWMCGPHHGLDEVPCPDGLLVGALVGGVCGGCRRRLGLVAHGGSGLTVCAGHCARLRELLVGGDAGGDVGGMLGVSICWLSTMVAGCLVSSAAAEDVVALEIAQGHGIITRRGNHVPASPPPRSLL
ncbi:hypothetical protein BCR34DRAFT_645747 [Clohesyomyces aquaticus]|uniref:Uncharacterized protein n=1 Tax=Clohesyomyces aquaticus TaxID=1231657 RepID=A0A1Y1ZX86_9PLEO|nr:hypothetical protein BCR34DRAFT_645747 [Clohesyomyces aquaticus]